MTNHGGKIVLTSVVNDGSTFTITLPAHPDEDELLISSRRSGVLERSISRLKRANDADLKAITHEIGGAIGFYGFENEGRALLEISRATDSQATASFLQSRQSIDEVIKELESHLKVLLEE